MFETNPLSSESESWTLHWERVLNRELGSDLFQSWERK